LGPAIAASRGLPRPEPVERRAPQFQSRQF